MENTDKLEVAFQDSVTDVSWNPKYHMFAISGFGSEYPVCVYSWENPKELTEVDYDKMRLKIQK